MANRGETSNESMSDELRKEDLNDNINDPTNSDELHIPPNPKSIASQEQSTSSNVISAYSTCDDEPPIHISVENRILPYIMNLPSGAFSKGSKSSELIKDMMPITIEQMDKETKVKLLQCQLADLKNQLAIAKKKLEETRKDKIECVQFMRESVQNAERDVIISRNKSEYYRQLLAEKRAVAAGRIKIYRGPNAVPVYTLQQSEVRLLTLASMYLSVHSRGIPIDLICSYLSNFVPNVDAQNVENLLRLFRTMFREETTGTHPNVERNWKYLCLK